MASHRLLWSTLLLAGALACNSKNASDLSGVQIPSLPPDTFSPIGSITGRAAEGGESFLLPGRHDHSQTLLRGGLVLLAGGTSGQSALASAAIYDQRSAGLFSTGSLRIARSSHTASLAPNGDVVVIGGLDALGQPTDTAEIYRTATGTWELLPRMAVPRFGHTATVLPSGSILVAGGITSVWGHITDRTEILDASTGLFSDATPMQAPAFSASGTPRAFHTATRIPRSATPPVRNSASSCAEGNTDDVVLFVGGLTGPVGGFATSVAGSVAVLFPLGTTPSPAGGPRPGAYEDVILAGGGGPALRWAHGAHRVFCDASPADPMASPSVTVMLVGGLGAFVPPLGALTSTVAGSSVLEDSEFPRFTYAALQVDLPSLASAGPPLGVFLDVAPGVQEGCIGMPLACPPFVGGAGARSVFHEGLGAILALGGNGFDASTSTRSPYGTGAFLIDVTYDPGTLTLGFTAFPAGAFMSEPRSFPGLGLLPGPDGVIGTDDDTALVTGGAFAPSGEVSTAEEYAFP